GCRPADPLSQPFRYLLAALAERLHDLRQRDLPRAAHGRRVARQVNGMIRRDSNRGRNFRMARGLRAALAAAALLPMIAAPALAQKPGGTLVMQHWDSPASTSTHAEA